MKKIISFFILLILVNLAARGQQESFFANYMVGRTMMNPGFTGSEDMIKAVFCNRTDFAGFGDGKPVTSVFGADAPVEIFGIRGGLGLQIVSDQIGFQDVVDVDFTTAYHRPVAYGKMGFAIRAGFRDYNISPEWEMPNDEEFSDLFSDPSGDPGIPTEMSSFTFGIGFGAYYETSDYYVGISADNLNMAEVKDNEDLQERVVAYYVPHFYLTGQYNIELPDPLYELRPSFMLGTDFIAYMMHADVQMYYDKKYRAGLGLSITPKNIAALTFFGGVELKSGLNLGYALDVNTSALLRYGATSHEVIVTYSFNLDMKRDQKYKSVRYL